MRDYNIFIDEMNDGLYQIGLIPDSRVGGAVATKSYSTKAEFVRDLQRLGYTDGAIARFFEAIDKHQTLLRHPLSDEEAGHFGWLQAFNAA
jgi:hypothetical protein